VLGLIVKTAPSSGMPYVAAAATDGFGDAALANELIEIAESCGAGVDALYRGQAGCTSLTRLVADKNGGAEDGGR